MKILFTKKKICYDKVFSKLSISLSTEKAQKLALVFFKLEIMAYFSKLSWVSLARESKEGTCVTKGMERSGTLELPGMK